MFSWQHTGIYTTHQHVTIWDQEQLYISRLCQGHKLLGVPAQFYPWGQGNALYTYSTAIYSWLFKTQAVHSPLLLIQAPFLSLLFALKTGEVWGSKVSSREISYRFSSETWGWAPTRCHLVSLNKSQCWRTTKISTENHFFILHLEKQNR